MAAGLGPAVGVSASAGIIMDDKGNSGLYLSGNVGIGSGTLAASAGGEIVASNGRAIHDMSGASYDVQLDAAALGKAVATMSVATTLDGHKVVAIGGNVGLGIFQCNQVKVVIE